jgi:hypothetical protein
MLKSAPTKNQWLFSQKLDLKQGAGQAGELLHPLHDQVVVVVKNLKMTQKEGVLENQSPFTRDCVSSITRMSYRLTEQQKFNWSVVNNNDAAWGQ